MSTKLTAKFRLGRIVVTPNALNSLTYGEMLSGLLRHVTGDWGEVCREDRAANDQALVNGTRIFSVYRYSLTFWIITEAGRSVTTVLMPEDY